MEYEKKKISSHRFNYLYIKVFKKKFVMEILLQSVGDSVHFENLFFLMTKTVR